LLSHVVALSVFFDQLLAQYNFVLRRGQNTSGQDQSLIRTIFVQ